MDIFTKYLSSLENPAARDRTAQTLGWVGDTFSRLQPRVAWNQPMFTDHGTFIIGFSAAKKHMSIAPERKAMQLFAEEIARSGYSQGKELFRIPWDGPVDYALLERIIRYNMTDKADCKTFWHRPG